MNLPPTLTGLYAILANPLVAPIWLSHLLEQFDFIKSKQTDDRLKALACLLTGQLWAILVGLGQPGGIVLTPEGIYSVVVAGFGVSFVMTVYNVGISSLWPALSDFFLKLFGRITTKTETSFTAVSGDYQRNLSH